jgi:hypothetical protein
MSIENPDEFEQQLTQRLRPVNAPETLAKFLAIAAAAEEQRRNSGRWFLWFKPRSKFRAGGGVLVLSRPMAWTGAAMAMAMLLAVFIGEQVHVRRERTQAEVATREFEAATQITDRTLQHTREQLERAGIRLDQ